MIHHAVTQKLEPLVIRLAKTAVSQRLVKQRRRFEIMAQSRLKRLKPLYPHRQLPPAVASNSNRRLTLPAMGTVRS